MGTQTSAHDHRSHPDAATLANRCTAIMGRVRLDTVALGRVDATFAGSGPFAAVGEGERVADGGSSQPGRRPERWPYCG
jgi:hypothetical protein